MSVSVEEISRRAGVGRATAYRVLTDHPHVSAATREKVMGAVRELGYPRLKPRRTGRSRGGYVLWGPLGRGVEPDAFFSEVREALMATMSSERKPLRSISYPVSDSIEDFPLELSREQLDGIFTVAFYSNLHLKALATRWPLANLLSTRRIPGAVSVSPDYAEAARIGVEHLLELGHRRIGLVTGMPDNRNFSHLFTEGYCGALTMAGLPTEPKLIHADRGNLGRVKPEKIMPLGVLAGRALLSRSDRPTALLARQDSVAGLLAAAEELGLRIPDDLSILAFGTESGAAAVRERTTSVCFRPDEMVDLALQMISAVPREGAGVTVPVRLVEGLTVRKV